MTTNREEVTLNDYLRDIGEDPMHNYVLPLTLGERSGDLQEINDATGYHITNLPVGFAEEIVAESKAYSRLIDALSAIASTIIDEKTDYKQLTALHISIAKITLEEIRG